jgi:hypothetical protein
MPSLIGNKPNQVSTNGDLGTLAFQDASNVKAGSITADTLVVDTNTLVVNATNDRVGVGIASPTRKLHVHESAAATNVQIQLSNATTGSTETDGFQLITTSDGLALVVQRENLAMEFWTNNTVQMDLQPSGNFRFNSGYGSVATAYGCRAWVNFNGTGTVAIRASGNVSSITDNGTGNYSVNLATAMPDSNYAAIGSGGISGDFTAVKTIINSTTQFNIDTSNDNRSWTDALFVFGAVFR